MNSFGRVLSDKGQTSVEYILLLAAIVFLMFNSFSIIREKVLARQNPCPPDDRSLGCVLSRSAQTFGAQDPSFRYFTLRK